MDLSLDAGAVWRADRTSLRYAGRLDPILLVTFAIGVSAAGAARPSLWFDEAATISAATRSVP